MLCGHKFSLKQRPMLAPSRYFKHVHRAQRKLSRFFQKKFNLKTCEFVRIFQLDFELHLFFIFFKIPFSFYCSLHVLWLVCHVVSIFLLLQRSRLGGPFCSDILKMFRKFSRDFWKKFYRGCQTGALRAGGHRLLAKRDIVDRPHQ